LLTGIAPIAAALAGVALGGPAPRPLVWVGIAVVGLGLAIGLRTARPSPGPAPGHPLAAGSASTARQPAGVHTKPARPVSGSIEGIA
jgi:hypothetical protein